MTIQCSFGCTVRCQIIVSVKIHILPSYIQNFFDNIIENKTAWGLTKSKSVVSLKIFLILLSFSLALVLTFIFDTV